MLLPPLRARKRAAHLHVNARAAARPLQSEAGAVGQQYREGDGADPGGEHVCVDALSWCNTVWVAVGAARGKILQSMAQLGREAREAARARDRQTAAASHQNEAEESDESEDETAQERERGRDWEEREVA